MELTLNNLISFDSEIQYYSYYYLYVPNNEE